MCGIVGFFSKEKQEDTLERMLTVQAHRGPDDRGTYIDTNSGIHLGHNRLSVQDLSLCGHQPFISDCGQYIIVFNGEVYNFKTLKAELKELGYEFVSNTDTEVLLYSYKEWGIESINKFIGMFAFSILDKATQSLYLVRDRAGVKPLYYFDNNVEFLFSSELKSFHEHSGFTKELNKEILPYYFQFGYIPAPHSVFKDCYKLKPGHYLKCDILSGKKEQIEYWNVNDYYLMDKFNKSEEQIISDVEELLVDSCKLRIVSDVPVGVFLSGGYDSSIVASILQKISKDKIRTFTIGFGDKDYNEAGHAKKISEYLGTNHKEYYCTQTDMLNLLDKLPKYWDEPFADTSALPTLILSELARKEVSVALSADGGDEAFCGYSKYFMLNKVVKLQKSPFKYKIFKCLINMLDVKSVKFFNFFLPVSKRQTNIVQKFNKFKQAINSNSLSEMFINGSSHVNADFLDDILIDGSYKNFDETDFSGFNQLSQLDVIDQMMAIDYKTFMNDDVLTKVDRATMSVSLEGREPLLDHRIIEYMARVPMEQKYKGGQGKYILRQVLYKNLPKELVERPKAGFTIPLEDWILTELKEKAIECLESKILTDDEIFDQEKLSEVKDNLEDGKVENPVFIWMVMTYVLWRKQWA